MFTKVKIRKTVRCFSMGQQYQIMGWLFIISRYLEIPLWILRRSIINIKDQGSMKVPKTGC